VPSPLIKIEKVEAARQYTIHEIGAAVREATAMLGSVEGVLNAVEKHKDALARITATAGEGSLVAMDKEALERLFAEISAVRNEFHLPQRKGREKQNVRESA
jgi:phage-related tail protein